MRPVRAALALASFLSVSALSADPVDWRSIDDLPQVDFSSLTPTGRALALDFMRRHGCTCGCKLCIAECRIADPLCPAFPELTDAVIDSVGSGRSLDDLARVIAAAAGTPSAAGVHGRTVLEDDLLADLAGLPAVGAVDARHEVVVFTATTCNACRRADPSLRMLAGDFPKAIRITYVHVPDPAVPTSEAGSAAAYAAAAQGCFVEMQTGLFASMLRLSEERIRALALELGLDLDRFDRDRRAHELTSMLARNRAIAAELGLGQLPVLYVDGRRYDRAAFYSEIHEHLGSPRPDE